MKTITNKQGQQVIRQNLAQFTLLIEGKGCTLVDIMDIRNNTFAVSRVTSSEWISLEVFVKNYFGYKY
tara:strand:- start:316 stop:519 length:204 start_codon:yes stop_codon:yes gene_type:complete